MSDSVAVDSKVDPKHFALGGLIFFIMIITFLVIGQQKSSRHVAFGHEASYITLIGFIISSIAYNMQDGALKDQFKFDDNVLFYFCIPPIVFSSGYNMRRKRFFRNIKNIMIFGVFGTLVTYLIFSGLTLWIHSYGFMTMTNGLTGETKTLALSAGEILLMCSLLCSTDVIAAISMVSYDEQPTLFSLLFGEGIVNDAVAIILFNSVLKYTGENSTITASTPFAILLDFILLGVCSILIGLIYGIIASIFFKYIRSLCRDAAVECLVIFCFGYMAYCTAELCSFSGIIALLTSGVVMAHYGWYSLSPQGKHGSYLVFQTLGGAMTAFIFSYLGITFFAYSDYWWSWELILVEVVIIFIGRYGGTMGLIYLLQLCGYKSGITFKQLFFIGYAGLIRGAIAFGLVLRINHNVTNRSVIVTTCLTLVVGTTIILGATVGVVQKCLFQQDQENEESDTESFHEALLHPNEQAPEKIDDEEGETLSNNTGKKKREAGCCERNFTRCDELFFRPALIYEYERTLSKEQLAFFETFQNRGTEVEKVFREDNNDNASSNSKALADKVRSLQRKNTLNKDQAVREINDAASFNKDQDNDNYLRAD